MKHEDRLVIENDNLKNLCAEMYQVVGVLMGQAYRAGNDNDRFVKLLDQLLAASAGEQLPYDSILPFFDQD